MTSVSGRRTPQKGSDELLERSATVVLDLVGCSSSSGGSFPMVSSSGDFVTLFLTWAVEHRPGPVWHAQRVEAADFFWNNADIILAVACRNPATMKTGYAQYSWSDIETRATSQLWHIFDDIAGDALADLESRSKQ